VGVNVRERNMQRISIVAVLMLLAACATTLETVYVPADIRGWKLGYGSNRPGATIKEFIPASETISDWSRMVTIQFLEREQRSPSVLMQDLEARMRARCPSAKWAVISQDATSITYEWALSGCPGQSDQHEMARLLKGNDGVHRVAYVRKVPQLDSSDRDTWLKALANAYVEKGGQRVVVAP